jgi:hypothetical protein
MDYAGIFYYIRWVNEIFDRHEKILLFHHSSYAHFDDEPFCQTGRDTSSCNGR